MVRKALGLLMFAAAAAALLAWGVSTIGLLPTLGVGVFAFAAAAFLGIAGYLVSGRGGGR